MRKWMSHTINKVIGVVLLCVIGAYIVCGTALTSLTLGNSTYFETTMAQNHASEESWQVLNQVVRYGESGVTYLKERYSPENSNSRFQVERRSNYSGKYITVTGNVQEDEVYPASYTYTYLVREEDGEYYIYHSYDDTEEEGLYRVSIYINKDMNISDVYTNEYNLFTEIQQKESSILITMAISFVLGIIILILEFIGAGRRIGTDEISDNILTKLPYDVFTVVVLFIISLFGRMFVNTVREYSVSTIREYVFELIPTVFSLMMAALLFYAWLMTTAIHIKKKQLLNRTLIVRAIEYVFSWLGFLPKIWKVALGMLAWLFLSFLLIAVQSTGTKLFIFLFMILLSIGVMYQARYLIDLHHASKEIANGNLDYTVDMNRMKYAIPALKEHAMYLNSIEEGMQKAVQEQMRSERLKAELITNVSHDIKTPLTSIINYVDLLQKDHTEEQQKQYLEVLDRQSQRLKKLTEDVVEASKASTGNIEVHMCDTSIPEIIEQAFGEYEEKLQINQLEVIRDIPEQLIIQSDGRLLWRVFRNLLSNISKYALPGTRVYIDVEEDQNTVTITLKNTSKDALNISATQLLERFTRGDSSRHTEGSGLGLNIAQSLIELLGGTFTLTVDGDLFKVTMALPKK